MVAAKINMFTAHGPLSWTGSGRTSTFGEAGTICLSVFLSWDCVLPAHVRKGFDRVHQHVIWVVGFGLLGSSVGSVGMEPRVEIQCKKLRFFQRLTSGKLGDARKINFWASCSHVVNVTEIRSAAFRTAGQVCKLD